MFCPNCATQNADNTKYCRSCGANLSLVPQALTGQLPLASPGRRDGRHRRHREPDGPPNLGNGISTAFMGIGFVVVSLACRSYAPAGHFFWFWMLIPAFIFLGKGVAEIVSARQAGALPPAPQRMSLPPEPQRAVMPAAPSTGQLPASDYSHIPPPSVTEGTTRQLDPTKDPYGDRRS